jgi:ferredoxin-thioredoxin reductase catalytic chain
MMATEEELTQTYAKYAEKKGFKLNPDKQVVSTVIKGIIRNETKYGARYCPCRIRTGDKEKDKAIICPCIYHLNEIKEQGHCHCMIFVQ